MTQMKDQATTLAGTRLNLAEIFETLLAGPAPIRFTAYDGSSYGPEDAQVGLDLKNERGLAYMVTAPGDLGMARAYVSGDLDVTGVHPGDPYDGMLVLLRSMRFRRPSPTEALNLLRSIGLSQMLPPAAAAAGAPAALAPDGRGLPAQPRARRQGDPAPLRRLQPVLRDGPRSVDDLHLRALPDGATRPSRRRSSPSTTWSRASWTSRPASDSSTSAAAGAGWSATPPRSTASAHSA